MLVLGYLLVFTLVTENISAVDSFIWLTIFIVWMSDECSYLIYQYFSILLRYKYHCLCCCFSIFIRLGDSFFGEPSLNEVTFVSIFLLTFWRISVVLFIYLSPSCSQTSQFTRITLVVSCSIYVIEWRIIGLNRKNRCREAWERRVLFARSHSPFLSSKICSMWLDFPWEPCCYMGEGCCSVCCFMAPIERAIVFTAFSVDRAASR